MDESRRRTAQDFKPEVLDLFDRYVHGLISRRDFLSGAARYATGALGATALLEALSPQFAMAQQVAPDDPGLAAQTVRISSPDGYGAIEAYFVRPAKADGKLPAVLVIHENRGLNPHIEDIARRLALDGFLVLAPDALTSLGGYPGDEDSAREQFQKLEADKSRADFVAAANYLRKHEEANGKLGAVGFCWGGGMVNYLATRLSGDLDAGVPFYGVAPPIDSVPQIKAKMLLQFAENDPRVNAAWPPYEAALQAAKVDYHADIYPGTQHGFNNDTTPRYDAEAAKLAWPRTVDLFRETLS